jgi:hypothetical protein
MVELLAKMAVQQWTGPNLRELAADFKASYVRT